jgi:cortactin
MQSAVGWEHVEKVEKHSSQKDYSTGFGGKFGVQKERQDKSAVGFDYREKVEKHESQTGEFFSMHVLIFRSHQSDT